MRRFHTAIGTLLVAGFTGACDSNVVGTAPFQAGRCQPPPMLLAGAVPQPLGYPLLRDALVHAAGPMSAALGSSREVDQLRQSMEQMIEAGQSRTLDTACRLILVANAALDALPATPETLPDREGIRLVLMIAAGIVKAHP